MGRDISYYVRECNTRYEASSEHEKKKCMQSNKIIELKNDKDYYGKFGSKYLSNSDVKSLRNDIKSFRKPMRLNEALESGRYFHQLLLEEDKAKNFPMVEAKTRNSKEYKEYLEENKVEFVLKTNEAMAIKDIADWVMSDKTGSVLSSSGIYLTILRL